MIIAKTHKTKKPKKKNTYKLVMEVYHGDADHDEKNTHYYSANDKDNKEWLRQSLIAIKIAQRNDNDRNNWLSKMGKFEDAACDVIGIDTIYGCGDMLCGINGWDLYFIDENGIEWNTNIEDFEEL